MNANYLVVLLSVSLMGIACNDQSAAATEKNVPDASTQASGADSSASAVSKTVVADAAGSLVLTAENGTATGPEIKYMPEWKAFGWFGGKDQVRWEAEVASSGLYEVWIEWSVAPEEAGKEFILEAKDHSVTGKVKSSGSWETYINEKVGQIELNKGGQSIIFRPNVPFEKGAILDLREIKLVPLNK